MTPDERERVARLEQEVAHIREDLKEIKADMKEIRQIVSTASGGWRALLLVGGITTAAGAALAKLVPLLDR